MAAHRRVLRQQALNRRRARKTRVFKDRVNPLDTMDDEEIFSRFRFMPATIIHILGLLPNLSTKTRRNCPVSPLLQLLVTLRYLATGAMHLLIADSVRLSRETVGRIVRRVTKMIAALSPIYITFPTGDRAADANRQFSAIAGFPNVVGCVDGTQIRIKRPSDNEGDFVNRKGYHSLNVQMCCDANFKITSCNATWPGSVHDSRIFRSSALCRRFESGDYQGLLLGDSGYPCRHFLMTPFLNPNSVPKQRFNESLCRTRVLIEQVFGILKRRFQILHFEMQTKPEQAAINTVACAVLHNIGILLGDILPVDDDIESDQAITQIDTIQDGNAMREHIVQTFFN